jgi:prepilin-type processing-associated H-X9-DG protein
LADGSFYAEALNGKSMASSFIGSEHGKSCTGKNPKDMSYPASAAPSEHSAQEQRATAAFGQVDLLTVIGVLVLLGLLLIPALARTRVPDQAFRCRNNLRQLIQGWRMYAEDNSDKLPNCLDWVMGALSYSANNPDNTNISYLVNGLLGPYVRNTAVYRCPADVSQGTFGTNKLPRVRTESMSQAFAQYGEGHVATTYRHYLKSVDMVLPAPANLWVMIDESPDSINDGAFAVTMSPYGSIWQDGPSILHDGGCGFAFADGHSEIKQWTDRRTLAMKVTYTSSFPFGVSQPNNPDIRWLQDRTSAPR